MRIRILGCSGGIGAGSRTSAMLVDDDTAGSTVTITLPAAAGAGRLYHIKKLGTTANVIEMGMGEKNMTNRIKVFKFKITNAGPGINEDVVVHQHRGRA